MKIKTKDLTGIELDWAVAAIIFEEEPLIGYDGRKRCLGWIDFDSLDYDSVYSEYLEFHPFQKQFNPSTDWVDGGPIIEKEKIGLTNEGADWWRADLATTPAKHFFGYGPTPLIAAMRCFCSANLGDEVDIPEETRNDL